MNTRPLRRASLLSFAASGTVLAMTSTAFACTTFLGKLTVSAADPLTGATTTTAFTDGSGATHGYCPTPATVDNQVGGASELVPLAQGMYKASTFSLRVGPTTTCLPTQNSLKAEGTSRDNTYQVRWLNLTTNKLVGTLAPSCFVDGDRNQTVGTILITGGVAGPKSFPQGLSSAGDEVAICVKLDGAGAPPQVNLRMI